jgi:hypothetical protein
LPLQLPLVPQLAAPWSAQAPRGSGTAAGLLVQRPRELGNPQKTQVPVQAVSQQKPSTQKPVRHSLAAPQLWPFCFLPQEPSRHRLPAVQSALLAQLPLQVFCAQTKGAQATGLPSTQVPAPSHTLMGISLPPEQLAGLHSVPAAYLAQPPCPLQVPDMPQPARGSTRQTPCGSGLPAGAGLHSPILPTCLQLKQAPVQGTLQHTPSAHEPEAHSLASPQTAPSGFLPQELSRHSRPSH